MEACDLLVTCGYTRPIPQLSYRDVPHLIECVTLHSTILVVKAELDDLIKGLEDAGVLQTMRSLPKLFKYLNLCSYMNKSI